MSNVENQTPNVTQSMEAAEARVEAGKLNIATEVKGQIVSLERGIKAQIAQYKEKGIYSKVQTQFHESRSADPEIPISEEGTPETMLANIALRFDNMDRSEDARRGDVLKRLAEYTMTQLIEMKADLADIAKPLEARADAAAESSRAEALLREGAAIREQEARQAEEQQWVLSLREQIKNENKTLSAKVTALREESQGWAGYGHAIEPSNLLASIGGAFTDEGIKTKQTVQYELAASYFTAQCDVENGVTALLKTMRGSARDNKPPMGLQDAWRTLEKNGHPDFAAFSGSPDGHFFARTTLREKQPTEEDHALYIYEKARDIQGRIGREEAEPYFQAVIHKFPHTASAAKARESAMTSGEKAYQTFTEVGDVFLRLDMLALMAGSAGAGLLAARIPQAARVAKLIETYPQLSKVLPGVHVLKAGESAGLLMRGSLAFGNFTLEVGKFVGAVAAAEKVGGPKAAYAVGMFCFFMPGLMHGFEKTAGGHLEHAVSAGGTDVLKSLGDYVSKAAGGVKSLKDALVRGLQAEALAAGVTPSMQIIEKEVGEALMALSLEAQAVARRVGAEISTEGGRVLKGVGHHATDHAVKHNVAHGSGHDEEGEHDDAQASTEHADSHDESS